MEAFAIMKGLGIIGIVAIAALVIGLMVYVNRCREAERRLSAVQDSRDQYGRLLAVATGKIKDLKDRRERELRERREELGPGIGAKKQTKDPDEVRDYHTDLRMEYDTWKLWMEQPQTIEFMRCIKAGRFEAEHRAGQGKTLDKSNSDNTQAWTAHFAGYCRAIADILERIRPTPKPGSKS